MFFSYFLNEICRLGDSAWALITYKLLQLSPFPQLPEDGGLYDSSWGLEYVMASQSIIGTTSSGFQVVESGFTNKARIFSGLKRKFKLWKRMLSGLRFPQTLKL